MVSLPKVNTIPIPVPLQRQHSPLPVVANHDGRGPADWNPPVPASPLGDAGMLTTELKVVLVIIVDPAAVQQSVSCPGSDVRAQGVPCCTADM